ncbi:valine--tRNA ligase [Planctomyces sp. SH-PL62]|uniref:valine--tRNA ligase n=1 Tax=Planctomyces sp. SH-PL62 TaxID=1636152 RepID=UPI00078C7829|nr:valine--tRNA ligase [Planctomyces sp. SH-PL62]AMV38431.1 Valine--tRNA ligase [Planctomyces sp. SH-PL62]
MNINDIPKQYDPKDAQDRWYKVWLERGYFHADPASDRPPYCIVIPPPNVTGALHLGHALNNTLQDVLVRWRRMQGYDCLWMPGTDHAGIATQAVVERRLLEERKLTRHDVGREALVEMIWAWKDEYEQRILGQLRLMGCSCDWERTRFTLDEVCSRAVRRTFFNLFKAGKIFRGKRLVNWDVQLRTAVADDEIYYEDKPGKLWTIKYPVAGSASGEALHVATTRPETMLGDTAVAVHPEDPRYKHLIGQELELPLTGRRIPIVGDAILVDPKFGTGCVKVTPAHDPNDYQTGRRHGLPMINLLNPDGTYNENAGPKYAGLDRVVVRKRVVADLEAAGLLVKDEPYNVRLNFSDRSKTPIEPYLSDQWFVRMADDPDGSPGFAQQAIDAVTSAQVRITPERYAKSYIDWLAEKRDWCISRQLWWGHRIPIWHCSTCSADDLELAFGGRPDVAWAEAESGGWLICAEHDLNADALGAGHELTQDPDVLDTWFSSALWPHSTLGWPEQTPELGKFYPTSVLSTARDIITLWVARMVIFGQFNMRQVPFRDVYIHPVIQDGHGKRMSKSAGNGVDPVDIIEAYGADALRYTLAAGATETQDLRMPVEKLKLPDGREINTSDRFEQGRNFGNKIWNVARLVMMNLEGYEPAPVDVAALPVEDRWILAELDATVAATTADLDSFRFAEAAKRLREFSWGEFCDWYVEFVKGRLRDPETRPVAQRTAAAVLDSLCRLLHPFMPFLTEQIWAPLGELAPSRGVPLPSPAEPNACIAAWPAPKGLEDAEARATVDQWKEKIQAIRNLRAERNVPKDAKIAPRIIAEGITADRLRLGEEFIKALTGAGTVAVGADGEPRPADSAVVVLADAEVVLPLEGLIDKEAERAKLRKGLADLDKQINPLRGKLSNDGFTSRAPADVVAASRAKLAELEAQRASVAALLESS